MTDKRIKSYLEDRLKRLESIRNEREWTTAELGDIACCKQTLAYIDSFQEEPVREDLDKAAEEWDESLYRSDAFKAGAKWQAEQEYTCYEEAFEDGAKWKKEQMMKDAIEYEVKVDAGGYPYIPQMELYDYNKDEPLAEKGDKVKVIIIKSE